MGACNQCQFQNNRMMFPFSPASLSILNQSQRNEAILLSTTADRSDLFRSSNDCMIFILSYLSIKSICQLDIAATNTATRVIWLSGLQVTNHRTINEYTHCNGSIRWLVRRGIRLESLTAIGHSEFEIRIDGSTLLGLNVSSLRDVSFSNCDVGDAEVRNLANDCPNLSKICLHNCVRVTNGSIIALSKSCLHLIAIDIGKCVQITDIGLEAFATNCSNVRTSNLLNGVDICHLRRISLHACSNITDIGVSAVARNFHLLNNIDISDCGRITDRGVSAIADNCPELHTINVSCCYRITDIGVSAIAHNCPYLSSIRMRSTEFLDGYNQRAVFTDLGALSIASNCPLLSSFNLSCCYDISNIIAIR